MTADPTHLTATEPARHALASVFLAILERHGTDELDAVLSQADLLRGGFEKLDELPDVARTLWAKGCYALAKELIG